MRRFLILSAFLAVAALAPVSSAAKYIEQETTAGGMMGQPPTTTKQRLWISGEELCTQEDSGGMVSMMTAEGTFRLINPQEKSFYEGSAEDLQRFAKMGMQMLQQMGQGKPVTTSVEKTGNTTKIGDWDAYEVVARVDGPMSLTLTFWLSEEIGVDLAAWTRVARMMQLEGMMGDLFTKLADYKGYPVKQESNLSMMGMQIKTSSLVTLVEERALDKKVCGVPEGFKRVESPLAIGGGAIPGMPGQ